VKKTRAKLKAKVAPRRRITCVRATSDNGG
jgi:hypothetical protein